MLLEFVHLCGISEDIGADYMHYAEFFKCYGNLVLPFVCALSMPELQNRIKKIFPFGERQIRTIGPQTLPLSRNAAEPKVTATLTAR